MILGCEHTDRASASHHQIVSLEVESSRNLKVLEPLGCFRESLNVFPEPYGLDPSLARKGCVLQFGHNI
jgi:hypothetical protein